jgi:HAMP domain-containing protein
MIEYVAILLIAVLAIILSYHNKRMASAIRNIEDVVQDYYAMEIRARRAQQTRDIDSTFNAFEWIGAQVSAGLDYPLQVSEILRLVPEVSAIDLRTVDNRRLVVSTLPLADLLRFDKRLRANGGKSVTNRLEAFASHPLLNQSRWGRGVEVIERALTEAAEFFDLEAQAAGTRLGINWRQPSKLWFYVVE